MFRNKLFVYTGVYRKSQLAELLSHCLNKQTNTHIHTKHTQDTHTHTFRRTVKLCLAQLSWVFVILFTCSVLFIWSYLPVQPSLCLAALNVSISENLTDRTEKQNINGYHSIRTIPSENVLHYFYYSIISNFVGHHIPNSLNTLKVDHVNVT